MEQSLKQKIRPRHVRESISTSFRIRITYSIALRIFQWSAFRIRCLVSKRKIRKRWQSDNACRVPGTEESEDWIQGPGNGVPVTVSALRFVFSTTYLTTGASLPCPFVKTSWVWCRTCLRPTCPQYRRNKCWSNGSGLNAPITIPELRFVFCICIRLPALQICSKRSKSAIRRMLHQFPTQISSSVIKSAMQPKTRLIDLDGSGSSLWIQQW